MTSIHVDRTLMAEVDAWASWNGTGSTWGAFSA